jgi:hypothetical protein
MTERITNTGPQGGIRINSNRSRLPTAEEREEMYEQFEHYYAMGMSDLRIAETVGACDRTVRRWRWRNGLANLYGRVHEEK